MHLSEWNVALDLLEGDLRELVISKERDQVIERAILLTVEEQRAVGHGATLPEAIR